MFSIDPKLLFALQAVITEQSFERAANRLNITQSAISQRIKQLEQLVAQPVLVRNVPIVATPMGEKLLRYAKELAQVNNRLHAEIFPNEQQQPTKLAIGLNADTLASWFIPAIAPLLETKNIELDLHVSNEATTQKLLTKGEVFAALSSQDRSVAGCKTQYIGELQYVLCASPQFVKKYFTNGITKSALTNAPAVDFDANDNMHRQYIMERFGLATGDYPCHRVRSSEAFVNLAVAGLVYTLLPMTQAKQHLDNRRLINIAPKEPLTQHLYWHSWVLEKGVFKQVSEHVVDYAKKLLASY
ncbi:LysR family transcriptional regulator ArgP [Thalassotalea euphylliae]|uniref:LysR family transcriptional regulator ArgP n=1 Tax=Thalassotalea euphylliae TaxID=1655234 RepID=UPI00362B495A